ncbi:hypothetical protein ACFV2Q_03735 [Streptomyces sp. NPDC059650]|uniref:hypothetical protein n=1 Tax=Streptomyces sp. NPDC059650 TaxID=3346896 RepID=UPI0036AFF035
MDQRTATEGDEVMTEAVPVRCPVCLRESSYAAPVFPCACGTPAALPLDLTAPPVPLTHRTWSDSWVAARCGACGLVSEWPQPEVGCGSCGTVVRVAVHPVGPVGPVGTAGLAGTAGADGPTDTDTGGSAGPRGSGPRATGAGAADFRAAGSGAADARAADSRAAANIPAEAHGPAPAGPPGPYGPEQPGAGVPVVPRQPFRPMTIRTARDAVAAAALYLRWLGFRDVRQPDGPSVPTAAVDLRAPGLVAQVDPTTAPAGLRAVECVWLNGLTASATSVYFALAGYTHEARTRADDLRIPLFVMDLTGTPQPLNDSADALVTAGA